MAKKSNQHDLIRISANVIFAITQILCGYLPFFGIGQSINSQSDIVQTPVIPAGYTFSIWGFIFAFSLAYVVYQAIPEQRENKLLRNLGWFTAVAFFGNTIWEIVAQTISFNWPTVIIIIFTLIASLLALFKLSRYQSQHTLTIKKTLLIYIPISTLAAWVSVATFANISSVLYQLHWYPFGGSLNSISFALLMLATVLAGAVVHKTRGNSMYAITIIWAFIGIIIANTVYRPNIFIAVTGVVLTLLVLLIYLVNRNQEK
jgi:MFS family permease